MGRTLGMIGQAANDIGDSLMNYTTFKRERDDQAEQRRLENERWDKQFNANQEAVKEDREFRRLSLANSQKQDYYNAMSGLFDKMPKKKTIDDLVIDELGALKIENPAEYRRTLINMKKYANPVKDDGLSDPQEWQRAKEYRNTQVRRLTTKLSGSPEVRSQPGYFGAGLHGDFSKPETVMSFAQSIREGLSPEMQATADSANVAYSTDPMELENTWGRAGVGRNLSIGRNDNGEGRGRMPGRTPEYLVPRRTLGMSGGMGTASPTDSIPTPPQGYPQAKLAEWEDMWRDFRSGNIDQATLEELVNFYMSSGQ